MLARRAELCEWVTQLVFRKFHLSFFYLRYIICLMRETARSLGCVEKCTEGRNCLFNVLVKWKSRVIKVIYAFYLSRFLRGTEYEIKLNRSRRSCRKSLHLFTLYWRTTRFVASFVFIRCCFFYTALFLIIRIFFADVSLSSRNSKIVPFYFSSNQRAWELILFNLEPQRNFSCGILW